MKILLIHQVFMSHQESGGTRHAELARALAEKGHELVVLASQTSYLTGDHVAGTGAFVSRERTGDGYEVWRCFHYPWLHRSYPDRVVAFAGFALTSLVLGLRVRDVDVVWGTSPPIFQAWTALTVAKLRRLPFMFEVRDLWPDFAIELGLLRNPPAIAVAHWVERHLYRRADLVVPNSPGYVDHVKASSGIEDENIVVVPNGVDVDYFANADPGDARERFGLEGKFLVLYAGAHGAANDLEALLSAAEKLRHIDDLVVLLAGDGKEKANLTRLAREKGLDNLKFLPAQPKSAMPGLLASVEVCVATLKNIPMFSLPYPNKVFDYLAAGKPVVLAIDGSIRDVVETAGAGIFSAPGDPEALARAIEYLYSHNAERVAMGEKGQVYVRKNFDRRVQADAINQLFERLGAERRPIRSYRGKRTLDLTLSLAGLATLWPVIGIVAASVRFSLGRPVLFRQVRPGAGGRPFVLNKFRTMTNENDNEGNLLSDRDRLTPLGRFLRGTSLDELPELLNVVRGDMSLVGPRPLLMRYLPRYSKEQRRRNDALPGITGLVQVEGRNELTWEEKFKLDTWYVDNLSLRLDLSILARTATAVIQRRGVRQPGSATMDEFSGEPAH